MKQHEERIIERLDAIKAGGDGPVGVTAARSKDARIDEGKDKNDLVVIITTNSIDLSDEVVVPSGMEMGYLLKNRKVFADHEYGIEQTVGWMREDPKPFPNAENQTGWKCRIGLIPENPIAQAIKAIVKATGQIGVSIGFRAIERGTPTAEELERYAPDGREISTIIRRLSVFEFSLTSLPCNVDCQSKSVTRANDEAMRKTVLRLVDSGEIDRDSAEALGVRVARKVFHVERTERTVHASGLVIVRRAAS